MSLCEAACFDNFRKCVPLAIPIFGIPYFKVFSQI